MGISTALANSAENKISECQEHNSKNSENNSSNTTIDSSSSNLMVQNSGGT